MIHVASECIANYVATAFIFALGDTNGVEKRAGVGRGRLAEYQGDLQRQKQDGG